jgi:hypothetical protein
MRFVGATYYRRYCSYKFQTISLFSSVRTARDDHSLQENCIGTYYGSEGVVFPREKYTMIVPARWVFVSSLAQCSPHLAGCRTWWFLRRHRQINAMPCLPLHPIGLVESWDVALPCWIHLEIQIVMHVLLQTQARPTAKQVRATAKWSQAGQCQLLCLVRLIDYLMLIY